MVSKREALADDKDRMAFAWNQCEWAKNREALVTKESRLRCGGGLQHRLRAMQLKHWKRPDDLSGTISAGASQGLANRVASKSHRWLRHSDGAIKRMLTIVYFDRLEVPGRCHDLKCTSTHC